MPKPLLIAFAAIVVFLTARGPAFADTQLGIQALVITGTHYQPKGNVSGTGAGALVSIDQRWRAVQLHVEGFPNVGTATVNTDAGPVRASIGLFAATARLRLGRAGRFWAGMGTEILAQTTPQAGLSKIDASRLAGTRYEVIGSFPNAKDRFIETQVAVVPHMSGVVYETKTPPNSVAYTITGSETAAIVDLSAAYGIRRRNVDYLVGVHAINFAAKFSDGREADRNVGAGLSLEIRFHL